MAQDYCGVQRAAAEKLFTHSGSQPDLAAEDAAGSADEDGDFATGASAMSPAATEPSNGYQAAEGKRQRQKLLGQLRELVPPSAARLLVDPLLDGSICDPPSTAAGPALSLEARSQAAAAPGDTPSGEPLQRHGNRVAAEVWRTALIALAQQWPALPALLALGTVERLTSEAQTASDGNGARWAAWLIALLRSEDPAGSPPKGGLRSPSASPSVKRNRADAAAQEAAVTVTRLWTPDPQQTACLVKKCLAASARRGTAPSGSQRLVADSMTALLSATSHQDDPRVTELAQKVGICVTDT